MIIQSKTRQDHRNDRASRNATIPGPCSLVGPPQAAQDERRTGIWRCRHSGPVERRGNFLEMAITRPSKEHIADLQARGLRVGPLIDYLDSYAFRDQIL